MPRFPHSVLLIKYNCQTSDLLLQWNFLIASYQMIYVFIRIALEPHEHFLFPSMQHTLCDFNKCKQSSKKQSNFS